MRKAMTDTINFKAMYLAGLVLAFVSIGTGGVALASEADSQAIPDAHKLTLKDMQGKDHSLHDYAHQGKWLVVMVWQSDCHVCNQEAESYVSWYESNKEGGQSTIMGISTDGWENREAAAGFLKEHDVTFPSFLVSFEALNDYYMTNVGQPFFGTPSFLIYSPAGELVAAQTGAVPVDLIDNFIESNSKQAQAKNQDEPKS